MPADVIQEDIFSSDEEFQEDNQDEESSTDEDEKIKEDDIFDAEFLKCYSALKEKSAKIYDKNVRFFSNDLSTSESDEEMKQSEDGNPTTSCKSLENDNKKIQKPRLTLLDHQLSVIGDELDELPPDRHKVDLHGAVSKSYYEKELEEIKKKINEIVDSDSDDDLLFVKGTGESAGKTGSKHVIGNLLSKIEHDEDSELQHLKTMWEDPENLTEEDRFLRDYILNKRYLPSNDDDKKDSKNVFFSENLEDLSDVDDDNKEDRTSKGHGQNFRSEENSFEELARIPRNATKTIRDLQEKRQKNDKRLKKVEKERGKKKALKEADCEDVIGDIKTKFHYQETEPNDYGLSAEELLSATDEELDKWINLMDAIKHRSKEEEIALKNKFEKKRNDIALKKEIFKSIYGEPQLEQPEQTEPDVDVEPTSKKRKRKKKRGLNHKKFANVGVAPDRLLSYGISKTKLKKFKLL